ncbi:MAG: cytochrome c biogenesis protein ResB, partial [Candidatus Coatesbacteria bacterium]
MKRILDILSSMRVAIILIIIVATLSVIGAFIPQERTEGFYVEKYGSSAGELIHHLMFDRIFKSFYFVALIL